MKNCKPVLRGRDLKTYLCWASPSHCSFFFSFFFSACRYYKANWSVIIRGGLYNITCGWLLSPLVWFGWKPSQWSRQQTLWDCGILSTQIFFSLPLLCLLHCAWHKPSLQCAVSYLSLSPSSDWAAAACSGGGAGGAGRAEPLFLSFTFVAADALRGGAAADGGSAQRWWNSRLGLFVVEVYATHPWKDLYVAVVGSLRNGTWGFGNGTMSQAYVALLPTDQATSPRFHWYHNQWMSQTLITEAPSWNSFN